MSMYSLVILQVFLVLVCVDSDTVQSKSPFLYRTVLKNGFHRDLQTTIKVPSEFVKNISGCNFATLDTFPNSIYIDPYQMISLHKFGGPQFSSPDVNIETPAYLSSPLKVTVFSPPLQKDGDYMRVRFTIPIHLRYHEPQSSKTNIGLLIHNPEFLVHCDRKTDFEGEMEDEIKLSCPQNKTKTCKWNKVLYKTDASQIHLDVPIGNMDHLFIVVFGTLASTVGACGILFVVFWRKDLS